MFQKGDDISAKTLASSKNAFSQARFQYFLEKCMDAKMQILKGFFLYQISIVSCITSTNVAYGWRGWPFLVVSNTDVYVTTASAEEGGWGLIRP